jgi:tetratricopeptide (TPR) repeat protein
MFKTKWRASNQKETIMTLNPLKLGVIATLTVATLTTATLILPASAMAGETASAPVAAVTDYQVKSSSNGLIKSGVKAFNSGDYAKSVALNKAVIRIRPSRMKTAIAQANLCASYAKLEDIEQASIACDAALALRPELEVAQSNQALLRTRLAQK